MRTLAILPVKRFALAKQRLRDGVSAHGRRALAAAMVADVLDALARCPGLERTLVVTNEELVVRLAEATAARTISDPHESGQSDAASCGIERAREEGFPRVLLVPGDCPALDPSEVGRLLVGEPASVVIVPDRHGTGTNALLMTPPDAIAPAFGPGSCARHRRHAEEAGVSWRLASLDSLALDIDSPDDLAALRAALAGLDAARAPRTRAVLAELP